MYLKFCIVIISIFTVSAQDEFRQKFHKIGHFEGYDDSGELFKRNYFLSNKVTSWIVAATECHRNGMEFLEFKTREELETFIDIARKQKNLFQTYTHVGGIATEGGSRHAWYWLDSGKKIHFDLNWAPREPNNNFYGTEMCLSIQNIPEGFGFNDIRCSNSDHKFLCAEDIDAY